ncbi:MAG TPA: hypothetical protein VHU85_05785 [Acidimicrobiales bacterium]|nr:hypothetical protein [Acidimicrobiales bacterium]
MSTLATTLRSKQESSGARGMIVLGLGILVAIAVAVLIVAQQGTTHPRSATATRHSSIQSRALGLSGTPGLSPATASRPAVTNVAPYRGTSVGGHQPGAVAPGAGDVAVSAASAAGVHTTVPTQVPARKSYGAVP